MFPFFCCRDILSFDTFFSHNLCLSQWVLCERELLLCECNAMQQSQERGGFITHQLPHVSSMTFMLFRSWVRLNEGKLQQREGERWKTLGCTQRMETGKGREESLLPGLFYYFFFLLFSIQHHSSYLYLYMFMYVPINVWLRDREEGFQCCKQKHMATRKRGLKIMIIIILHSSFQVSIIQRNYIITWLTWNQPTFSLFSSMIICRHVLPDHKNLNFPGVNSSSLSLLKWSPLDLLLLLFLFTREEK